MSELAMYQQQLLALHKNPHGFELKLDGALKQQGENIACGDVIELSLCVSANSIERLAFSGDSCAICRASASLLCEHGQGLSFMELKALHESLQGFFNGAEQALPEQLKLLSPISNYPVRAQCALLPWRTALALCKKVCKYEL